MKLKLFLQNESFKKHIRNIDTIQEDFIKLGCEKYLWRNFQSEKSDERKTQRVLSKNSNYSSPEITNHFMKQFNKIDLEHEVPFIYPQKLCKNYFIINEIVKKSNYDTIIDNIFDDDDTENHLVTLNIKDSFNIALLHKLVYSAYFRNNFGGYKIYNEDLIYFAEFTEYNKFVLSYPKPNDFVHFQGNPFRRDTDPFKILSIRRKIKHIINSGYFKDELQLFLSIYNDILPIFQKWWNISYNILNTIPLSDIRGKINSIYSDLVFQDIINSKWRNEKTLFQLVKRKYKNTLFQYSPRWLFPQSFDIFIPELNTAIEYQGIQHYKPIDYFGGTENFIHRKELDLKKRTLAENNNIKLIEWNYNESIDLKTLNEKLS